MFKEFENILKLILSKLDNQEILVKLDKISQNKIEPKFVDTAMLEKLYSYTKEQQKQLRGRVKNPLPYYQDEEGGKIRYKISEIDEWISLQKAK